MHVKPATGREAMIGAAAEVLTWQVDSGTVSFRGAIWEARSRDQTRMDPGAKVKILEVDGLTLVVGPPPPQSSAAR